jgi:hypothetical protein
MVDGLRLNRPRAAEMIAEFTSLVISRLRLRVGRGCTCLLSSGTICAWMAVGSNQAPANGQIATKKLSIKAIGEYRVTGSTTNKMNLEHWGLKHEP